MTSLPISDARDQLADLGNRVALRGERIVVHRRGKKLFALVSIEDLELIERLEDRADRKAIRQAQDQPARPWEDVKKALGL